MTLFVWVAAALATTVEWTEAPCPLDATDRVRVYRELSSNHRGGFDSDLAIYASDGQFRTYAVATCQGSLFSLYGSDMGTPLDPKLVPKLRTALDAATRGLAGRDPDVWERYAIAAAMYEILGRPPLFLADLWLQASWTVRDHGVGVFVGLEGPSAARTQLAEGMRLLPSTSDPTRRKVLLHNLARVAHRAGLPAERDAHLRAFEAVGNLTPAEADALARLRTAARVEPTFQERALQAFRAALGDNALRGDARWRAVYLEGELLRRLGRTDEARPVLRTVAETDGVPTELGSLAREVLALLP